MAELNDETITSMLQDKEGSKDSFDALLEKSPLKCDNLRNNLTLDAGSNSDNDGGAVKSVRRRIKRFYDSDSGEEADKENIGNKLPSPDKGSKQNVSSDSEDDIFPQKSKLVTNDSSDDGSMLSKKDRAKISEKKSKLRVGDDSSDDNTSSKTDGARINARRSKLLIANDSSDDEITSPKTMTISKHSSDDDIISPKTESARIGDKRSKLHDKFKGLLSSRFKEPEVQDSPPRSSEDKEGNSSDDSVSGIESIKQKIKQKSMLLKPGICDPDTSSDEESNQIQKQRKKKPKPKSAIMISPKEISKPARMSAKQAMENMQKIKSESNRMLREKEVSLPYHRPKALSLKDVMNRRKPALSADGKVLPLKMNNEQLKQYVKLLEQRNKEMMELCKSESEEEEEETKEPETNDNKESEQESSANFKELTDNNIVEENDKQNEEKEKHEENVSVVNETKDTNENDLPDLMIEVVPQERNLSNVDITGKDKDVDTKNSPECIITESETDTKLATEIESQLMELRYESEKMRNMDDTDNVQNVERFADNGNENTSNTNDDDIQKSISETHTTTESGSDKATHENNKNNPNEFDDDFDDDFSDVDINMEDLESIIENAKNDENAMDSPMLIREPCNLNKKPTLTGTPGMVIDLDGSNPVEPRKLTGVELLKERFTYYAKLKTPEEKERERESKIKPGMQHFKLKQELEEKISEQRSLEWAKRLEEEKQHEEEMNAIRGEESDGDDLEKIEAKLQDKEHVDKESSSESEEEEEEEEDTCIVKDKPRKRNPMIDDEAEVSEDDETGEHDDELANEDEGNENGVGDVDNDDDEDSEDSSDESSEDEKENQSKLRKGRILKAFEDSDDESTNINNMSVDDVTGTEVNDTLNIPADSQVVKDSQDDVLPLAQINKSNSEDLFASQTSSVLPSPCLNNINEDTNKISDEDCADMTTQTFSILNTNTSGQSKTESILNVPAIDIICDSQAIDNANLDDVVAMCSGKLTQTQNVIPAESQLLESQCVIGEDILEMCTGKFYDNQFVSQAGESENNEMPKENMTSVTEKSPSRNPEDKDLLDAILKEMDEPVNQEPIKTKYVFDNPTESEAVSFEVVNQVRKKFTIDSDDESALDVSKSVKKKKLKKRKLEKRALQISDDEEEEEQFQSDEEVAEYMSEVEEDDGVDRIVEYDSEENEVEVKPEKQKKKRKMAEFFEQEAELTSEDEWVGSGDEDERGLDRMEREEGDDDTFHQGRLQRELGQIHMRDVLDQDKREVRLIQELLFEDGDLGDGHRQRKFRWKNLDGEEDAGSVPDLFADSQEQEFESEELWRKQRHEREVFLRSLKEKQTDEQNISIDRSTIIKANLCSKTMSSLLLEANGTKVEETTVVMEKKKVEPIMPLPVFQQSYHGSLLTRGRGALARLAALAMPLAGEADDDSKPTRGPSGKRNFVFAAVTPPAKETKAPKRKADNVNVGTPRLIKKLKTDDKQKLPKASLLDHLKAL